MKFRYLLLSWVGAALFCIENPFTFIAGFAILAYGIYKLGKSIESAK